MNPTRKQIKHIIVMILIGPNPLPLQIYIFFFCTRQTQVFFLRTEIRLDKKKTQSFHIPVVDRKVFLTKYFLVFYLISMSCPIA